MYGNPRAAPLGYAPTVRDKNAKARGYAPNEAAKGFCGGLRVPQHAAPGSLVCCSNESPLHVGADCYELSHGVLLQLCNGSRGDSPNHRSPTDFGEEIVSFLGFDPVLNLL